MYNTLDNSRFRFSQGFLIENIEKFIEKFVSITINNNNDISTYIESQ